MNPNKLIKKECESGVRLSRSSSGSFIICVTYSQSFHLSGAQWPHLSNRTAKVYCSALFWETNKLVHFMHPEQSMRGWQISLLTTSSLPPIFINKSFIGTETCPLFTHSYGCFFSRMRWKNVRKSPISGWTKSASWFFPSSTSVHCLSRQLWHAIRRVETTADFCRWAAPQPCPQLPPFPCHHSLWSCPTGAVCLLLVTPQAT